MEDGGGLSELRPLLDVLERARRRCGNHLTTTAPQKYTWHGSSHSRIKNHARSRLGLCANWVDLDLGILLQNKARSTARKLSS